MKSKIGLFILMIICMTKGQLMANEILNNQQKAMAQVAAYAALGNQEQLKQTLADGLDKGVSVNEFKEILTQVYAYCGFPRSLNALNSLMQVVKERGNKDNAGSLPSPKPQGNPLDYGTANQTKLTGSEVKGELFKFAPAIDEYLKAHLFGDIFARDNLSWQNRELATVAMLAARDKVEPQLNAHIEIAKHNGLNDAQISEIVNIAHKAKAQNVVLGFGEPNDAYARYFKGKSYLQPLTNQGVGAANVTFEPKCRNNWHIHHKGGQILLVTAGRGWYQEWGKEPQELKSGDVVNIPAEVKHWHGAAKDSWFTHIALAVPADGASTEWLEEVSDEEYNKLK